MPEGPSIVILKEQVADFVGKEIREAYGNTKVDTARLVGQTVVAMRSWGKHFLIELPDFSVRIHLLMFGTYRINERKDAPARLGLRFADGELNFYTCSVQFIDAPLDSVYDWSADIMSYQWDPAKALKKLRAMPNTLACDAVLDQTVFSGAGNIFKNEVLFRIRVHPLSAIGALPPAKLRELVEQVHQYAFEFLEWKKAFVLKKHWLAHTKSICPRCHIPLIKGKLGKTNRRSFYCEKCQKKYEARTAPKTPHSTNPTPEPRTTKRQQTKSSQ
jgi:endonuclease-8